jgi:leucyl/phenylalanyl-tRNA--protein transferase
MSSSDIEFPPVELSDPYSGLLYVGGALTVRNLREAYSQGIFPWPHDDHPLLWFAPPERGIIDLSEIHIPKSLARLERKQLYSFTLDQAFSKVIRECQSHPRPGQEGTWITEEMIGAYISLHKAGYAHSIEAWRENRLVGGIYGVFVGGLFSGESMFGHENSLSKLCLLKLLRLLEGSGMTWMDIQMVTPVTEQLGGKYIDREEFTRRLEMTRHNEHQLKRNWDFDADHP